ncbi:MAG TPA: hypothetical protein VGJ84_23910 [Polyangiaceae bacterium]
MKIDRSLRPTDLLHPAERVLELGCQKALSLHRGWNPGRGAPVITVRGKYTTRGWTEWTQGFQSGSLLLCYDATGEPRLLRAALEVLGRSFLQVTHTGVHDHGFNNLSSYGNLLRLHGEGRLPSQSETGSELWRTALKVSGAVQASRWAITRDHPPESGYLYSFNGAHSLFIDSIRSMRSLCVSHALGHVLMGENDARINLLRRSIQHCLTTARYNVFYGDSGQPYDRRGRTTHEAIFNTETGEFRCRSTQQGYSPFSTWTRGLAWAILGFAEQLEFLDGLEPAAFHGSKRKTLSIYERAARATCDHYVHDVSALDGIPYWDDGAPGLYQLGDWRNERADPHNRCEPVDASAAAIAAQGLIRLGRYLSKKGKKGDNLYLLAGLSVAKALLSEPYLSLRRGHQGLLLHSVYHRPNGWDHIPKGQTVPCDESSMWGDYHLLELSVLIRRLALGQRYLTFFGCVPTGRQTAHA